VTHPSANRWILAALCLALLVMRVSGAHLHLCFDGSEPPLSYHVADSGVHHTDAHEHEHAGEAHDAGHEQAHDDRDLDVGQDLSVKKPAGKDFTLALITFGLLLFLVARPRAFFPTAYQPPSRASPRSYLQPPLRGPPSLA
jgi:hypothetical protein